MYQLREQTEEMTAILSNHHTKKITILYRYDCPVRGVMPKQEYETPAKRLCIKKEEEKSQIPTFELSDSDTSSEDAFPNLSLEVSASTKSEGQNLSSDLSVSSSKSDDAILPLLTLDVSDSNKSEGDMSSNIKTEGEETDIVDIFNNVTTESDSLDLSDTNKDNGTTPTASAIELGVLFGREIKKMVPDKPVALPSGNAISDEFLEIQMNLRNAIADTGIFKTPKYIYNPLEYALEPFKEFCRKYCTTTKKVLFLGMNPGPFGMCQTGIPFGDVFMVSQFLNISTRVVNKPNNECPLRPVKGFNCNRSEVSGHRFWSFVRNLCGDPDTFFKTSFVYNFCPVAFLDNSGKNITPNRLKKEEVNRLEMECRLALKEVVRLLQVDTVIALGRYTETSAKLALAGTGVNINYLVHPSPIVPTKDKAEWSVQAEALLKSINLFDKIANGK